MSHIRYTLAAALLTFGGVAVASAQQPTPVPQAHGHAGAHGNGVGRPGEKPRRNPLLRGITLSDAEKANLKNVESQHAAQLKALRDQYKPQHDAMRAARQSHDTAAMRTLWQKDQGERDQMKQLMLAQRNDVRGALTPANQATFDANVAQFQKHAANRAAKGKGRRGGAPGTGA